MFDREGFIEYVGEKSGNSYASGLGRIEKLFSVDIDAEYSKDKCEALLAYIENRKQHQDPKEAKRFSDAASHLKRYITYKMNAVDTITDRILYVIDHYKAHFGEVNKNEHYKWEALGWYKKHWDIDAEDFAGMLANAFSKTSNLLSSGMYYPYKMITEYAEADPEEVRRIFRILHDESIHLAERYQIFRDSCRYRIDQVMQGQPGREKALNHYQDLRAVMVYLTFEYPEKYYLFKSTMYSDFRDRIGFREEKTKQSSVIGKVDNFFCMCEMILEEIKKDQTLISMHKSRLDDSCYSDDALHLLTMDIVFYGSNYMTEGDFMKRPIEVTNTVYWPTLDEFDPGLTKEDWKKYLLEVEIPNHPSPMEMLKGLMELGGEATCKKLATIYGGAVSRYVGCTVNLGRRVKKYFDIPDSNIGDRERVYIIPFQGRDVKEDGGVNYSYRIRPELHAALQELDLSAFNPYVNGDPENDYAATDVGLNTILYGPPGTGKTYHTVIYAVAIIENKELAAVESEDYAEVLERYNEYKTQGRIAFTTFHQSYGYEEFIEGIRPTVIDENDETESGNVQYSVQPGIFKKFCEKADCPISVHARFEDLDIPETATVWKVSLYSTGDNEIRTECMQNGHIRIGWDRYGENITDETDFTVDGGNVVLNAFINKMQVGDIVFSCYSASTIDAIGIVTGEYEWHDEYKELKRVRKVNWLVKGIRENILALNGGKSMTLASVYRLSNIAMSDVFKIINKYQPIASGLEKHKDKVDLAKFTNPLRNKIATEEMNYYK